MLLGTPHGSQNNEIWYNVLLSSGGRTHGKKVSIASEKVKSWAVDFAKSGINVAILSAYEVRETKVHMGKLRRSKNVQVRAERSVRRHMLYIHAHCVEDHERGVCQNRLGS